MTETETKLEIEMIEIAGGILLAVFILIFLPFIIRALGIILLYLIGVAILIITYKNIKGYEEELLWMFVGFIIIMLIINIIKDWRTVLKGFIDILKAILLYACIGGAVFGSYILRLYYF